MANGKLKKPTHPTPEFMEVTLWHKDGGCSIYQRVESFGLNDGMLCITTVSATGVKHIYVFNMAFYLSYDAELLPVVQ